MGLRGYPSIQAELFGAFSGKSEWVWIASRWLEATRLKTYFGCDKTKTTQFGKGGGTWQVSEVTPPRQPTIKTPTP